MKNKFTRRALRKEERLDGGYLYRYTLSVTESGRVASYKLPLYSIAVELTTPEGEVTEAQTKEIFADAGKANSFFESLVEGLATPIDLAYIVEDEVTC